MSSETIVLAIAIFAGLVAFPWALRRLGLKRPPTRARFSKAGALFFVGLLVAVFGGLALQLHLGYIVGGFGAFAVLGAVLHKFGVRLLIPNGNV